jgi:hypothetical protein
MLRRKNYIRVVTRSASQPISSSFYPSFSHRSAFTPRSVLYPIPYTLYVIRYTLYVTRYTLYVICYTLRTIPYTLCASCSFCTMHYTLCTLRSLHYALCNMHYALCTKHYALCTMHFTLYAIRSVCPCPILLRRTCRGSPHPLQQHSPVEPEAY